MRKLLLFILSIFLMFSTIGCDSENTTMTPPDDDTIETPVTPPVDDIPIEDEFEDYGFEVIEIELSELLITEDGLYTSYQEVGAYIHIYNKLPSNYKTKSQFNRNQYTKENKLSCGGDTFYNRERLLPISEGRTYTECDIDYTGGSRNAKRIVYSNDNLIFYTIDHYYSFKILRFIESD